MRLKDKTNSYLVIHYSISKKTRQMLHKNRSYAHTYPLIFLAGVDQRASELLDTAGKSDSNRQSSKTRSAFFKLSAKITLNK